MARFSAMFLPERSGFGLNELLAPSSLSQARRVPTMVKDRNDKKLVTAESENEGERKPTEQNAAAIASHIRDELRIAGSGSNGCINDARKLKPEANGTRLIPSLRLKNFCPSLRPKENAHQWLRWNSSALT